MSSQIRIKGLETTHEGTLIGVGSFDGYRGRVGKWGSVVLLAAAMMAVGCDNSITGAELPGEDIPGASQSISRVVASQGFLSLDMGGSANLSALAFDATGAAVADAKVNWTSLDPSIARVNAQGGLETVAPGIARIAVRSGAATDTLAVAVLGGQNLLLLAGVDGSPAAEVRPGAQVTVPVTLDMSKVSPNGDLGSIQFELHYDPAVLEYVSGTDGLSGTAVINQVEPGRVRFAFASTDPQSESALTLANLTFKVTEKAPAGVRSAFSVQLSGAPIASDFAKYSIPMTFGGAVRVVAG